MAKRVRGLCRNKRGQVPNPAQTIKDLDKADRVYLNWFMKQKMQPSEREELLSQITKFLKFIDFPTDHIKSVVRILRKQFEGKPLVGEEVAYATYVDKVLQDMANRLDTDEALRKAFPDLWAAYKEMKGKKGKSRTKEAFAAVSFLLFVILMILYSRGYLSKIKPTPGPTVGPSGGPTSHPTITAKPLTSPTIEAGVTVGPTPEIRPSDVPKELYKQDELIKFGQQLGDRLPEVKNAGNQIWIEDDPTYILESDKFCPSPEEMEDYTYEVSLVKLVDIPAFDGYDTLGEYLLKIPLKKTEINGNECYSVGFLEQSGTLVIIRTTKDKDVRNVYEIATKGALIEDLKKRGITVWKRVSGEEDKASSSRGVIGEFYRILGALQTPEEDPTVLYVGVKDLAGFVKTNEDKFSNSRKILKQL